MKVFKRFSAAIKAANGKPFIQVGGPKGKRLYIVGPDDLHEVSLMATNKRGNIEYAGHVTLGHLNRLGNANHAMENVNWVGDCDAFPKSITFCKFKTAIAKLQP
jgi:hypothetical protein